MESPTHLPQVKTLQTLALETIITYLHEACQMDGQDAADHVEKMLDELYRCADIDNEMLFLSPALLNQDTLLTTACRTGNTAIVKNLLLRCGEHVSATDSNEGAVIETSAEIDGYTNPLRLARMINYVNHDGETALMLACQKGHVAIIQLLLGALFAADKRKALNHETKDAYTALMIASRHGDAEIVKVILDAYADGDRFSALNHEDNCGNTTLLIASRWDRTEVVKVILEAYADGDRLSALNHNDIHGNTALMCASRCERSEAIKVILESCPASDRLIALQQICKAGRTALFYAVSLGNADVVTVLLSALPSADQVQAISHIDYDGSKSITALCVKNYSYTGVYRTKFEATIKALFMPLSYSERLSILGYTESDGYTALTPITKLSKNFVMEQLEREAQQQYHSSLVPLSIFSRSVSLRLQSDDYTCRIS